MPHSKLSTELKKALAPDLEKAQGWPARSVAGVDEVGRGPWAGPVVAACIVLPPDYAETGLATLNDSKKLTKKACGFICHFSRAAARHWAGQCRGN